ncbi:MAG: hypothetical protein ACTHLE_04230 [Agriterribacter sp.]
MGVLVLKLSVDAGCAASRQMASFLYSFRMDKPNFTPLLEKLKAIIDAPYATEDLREKIPTDLKDALLYAL